MLKLLLLSAVLISTASCSEDEGSLRPKKPEVPRLRLKPSDETADDKWATKVGHPQHSSTGTGGSTHIHRPAIGRTGSKVGILKHPVRTSSGAVVPTIPLRGLGIGQGGGRDVPRRLPSEAAIIRPGSLAAAVVAAVKAPTLVIARDGTDRLAGIISTFTTARPIVVPYSLGVDELGNPAGTVLRPWYPQLTPLDSDSSLFEKMEQYFFATDVEASRGAFGSVMGPYAVTIGGTPHANVLIKMVTTANSDVAFLSAFIANTYNGGVMPNEVPRGGNERLDSDLGVFRFIKEVEYQRKAAEIIPGHVPAIYGAWLTSLSVNNVVGMIAMAKVPGKSFQQLYETPESLREAITGTNHEELCRLLARDLIRLLLAAGIIHDDTHMGNVMVHNELHRGREADCFVTQTEGCKLYLIDFGKARPYIASERAAEAGEIQRQLLITFGCRFRDE